MKTSFRRIVTAHNQEGRSFLLTDMPIEESAIGNFNFWTTFEDRKESQPTEPVIPFFPPKGGSIFRVFKLPPAASDQDLRDFAGDFFSALGDPTCRVDTSRHPLMHRTPTTDYIMLLDGEVSLLLDDGDPIALRPFDVVIQRATNHAWINTGLRPATLIAVMTGDYDPTAR